jgi:hypothetical protein
VICGTGRGAGMVGSGAAGVITGGGSDGGACTGGVVTVAGALGTTLGSVLGGSVLGSVDRAIGGGAVVDGGAVWVSG